MLKKIIYVQVSASSHLKIVGILLIGKLGFKRINCLNMSPVTLSYHIRT
jgi:hypothetical protein